MIKRFSLLAIIAIVITLSIIPTQYYLVIPGQGLKLEEFIHAQNGGKDAKGSFILTSTSLTKANLLLYLYSFLDGKIELMEKDKDLTAEKYMENYLLLMDKLMKESQETAKVIALKKAGYFPELIKHEGILVNDVIKNSPAKGKLIPGDLITQVNNTKIKSINDFSDFINKCSTGELVKIYFTREEKLYSTKVPIINISTNNNNEKMRGIGLYLSPAEIEFNFPFEVTINLEGVKGSSAGLMIALEILNQLTENDLSNGLNIAGTGMLELNGKIKPVTGIKQKLFSAKKNNADVFLVPAENYEKISKYNHKEIRIIPVTNFDDAIMKLIKL
jgi:PDZ domain-containing protein